MNNIRFGRAMGTPKGRANQIRNHSNAKDYQLDSSKSLARTNSPALNPDETLVSDFVRIIKQPQVRSASNIKNRVKKITDVYAVKSRHGETLIGHIKWAPSWHSYCFFPLVGMICNDKLLIELAKFCQDCNSKHRPVRQPAVRRSPDRDTGTGEAIAGPEEVSQSS